MRGLLKYKVNLGFFVNPFYLYCISFSFAIFVYIWGWCDIYPKLSASLLIFFLLTFILFFLAGYKFNFKKNVDLTIVESYLHFNDIIFLILLLLGILNILLMGYLPIIDRSKDYRVFGVHVIDPLFNTLSIFFSVFYFQSFLQSKKKRFLIYVIAILVMQILIFRRSTILWIFISSSFLFLLYKKKLSVLAISICIIALPLLSFSFGLFGNTRSNLSKSYVLNELAASNSFKSSEISHNHYMTYLYVSSPLANLQKNINEGAGQLNIKDFKGFFYYCLVPQSVTLRLEKSFNLVPPECNLITPDLIVGTFLMVSFFTFGWIGMIIMLGFLFCIILLYKMIIEKIELFHATTYSILCSTVSLLIFSNFLNRMDVILMLFFYPVFFNIVYSANWCKVSSLCRKKPKWQ